MQSERRQKAVTEAVFNVMTYYSKYYPSSSCSDTSLEQPRIPVETQAVDVDFSGQSPFISPANNHLTIVHVFKIIFQVIRSAHIRCCSVVHT